MKTLTTIAIILSFVFMFAGLLFMATSIVHAQVPTCNGLPATILGTERSDIIRGTDGPDVIVGLGGYDRINGMGGDDIICGGPGFDVIHGDDGDDIIITDGLEANYVNAREGNDTCIVSARDRVANCENVIFFKENTINVGVVTQGMVALDRAVYDIGGKVRITGEDFTFEDPATDLVFIDIVAPNGDRFSKLNRDQILFSSKAPFIENQLIAEDNTFWLQEGNYTVEASIIDNVARGNQDPADVTPKSTLVSATFTVNQPIIPPDPPDSKYTSNNRRD